MVKYLETKVVLSEIPNEITLAINITNCPCACKGCHSNYLSKNVGKYLSKEALLDLIKNNEGITCVAFMGGDGNPLEINRLASIIREFYPTLNIGWYSGRKLLSKDIQFKNFDYLKLGEYLEERGPLTSPTTNQVMYKVERKKLKCDIDFNLLDITNTFWK